MSDTGEPGFMDARPETARQPSVAAPEEAPADDLVFLDSVDGSGGTARLDKDKVEDDAAGLEFQTDREEERPKADASKGRSSGRLARISTGRHKRVSSGSNRALGAGDDWARRERSAEEAESALTRIADAAEPPPAQDPYVGKELGPFKVDRFVSQDRGLRAYLALDEETQENVLLRVYPLQGSYADEMKRLVARGERSCRVDSPSLSVCLGSGKTKECFFVGHELPMGRTLAELLEAGEVLDEKEIVTLLEQVGRGLSALHARELVHGDVSIHTIRRERPGSYVLVDAGLARSRPEFSFLSAGGEVLGTPGFIAPESVDSGKVRPSAELYALGCVGFTMVTLRAPFEGDDPVQVLLNQLNVEVPAADVPEGVRSVSTELKVVIGKLTGYTPSERYRAVSEMVADLRNAAQGKTIKPFPKAKQEPDPLEKTRKPVSAGVLLLVLLLLLDVAIGAAVVFTYMKSRAITLTDPVEGYHMPLRGVNQGGFGAGALEAPGGRDPDEPTKTAKTTPSQKTAGDVDRSPK